jgi:hypothetical protein
MIEALAEDTERAVSLFSRHSQRHFQRPRCGESKKILADLSSITTLPSRLCHSIVINITTLRQSFSTIHEVVIKYDNAFPATLLHTHLIFTEVVEKLYMTRLTF